MDENGDAVEIFFHNLPVLMPLDCVSLFFHTLHVVLPQTLLSASQVRVLILQLIRRATDRTYRMIRCTIFNFDNHILLSDQESIAISVLYGTPEGTFLFQYLPEKKLKQKELEKKSKQ